MAPKKVLPQKYVTEENAQVPSKGGWRWLGFGGDLEEELGERKTL